MMKKILLGLLLIVLFVNIGCNNNSRDEDYSEYLAILKNYSEYANESVNIGQSFTYANPDDQNLNNLKDTYQLETIAGNGGEISKIINLMNWVHSTIRHSGSSQYPGSRNALDILNYCKENNRAVNCRMMAIVLNEVYLAMGFRSRFVVCLPIEENPSDCHVINIVYSSTYQKWVYMDSTFNAYFKDENGNFLCIREVRERMCQDQPLIINDDINWNGSHYSKKGYKEYMSKNLFRFSCPTSSEFNYESSAKPRFYIDLNPKNNHSNETIKINGQITNYYISNPNYYWALPGEK